MEKTQDQAEKFNKRVGNVSSILGPLLFFPALSFEWNWWPIPPLMGAILGGAFYLLWIQTERKDFGLVNAGCLLRFAIVVAVIVVAAYLIAF